jgi:predicted MFS family arabinose efflux permease
MPIGALVGGLLGQAIGLRATMLVVGLGLLLAWFWVLFSPVRALHESHS